MTEAIETTEQPYSRLGGWLIVLAIGVVIAPIRLLIVILKDNLPAFSPHVWPALTTPGAAAYHPLWAPLLLSELVLNLLFGLFSVILAVFFFKRRKIFKPLMILFLAFNFVLVTADYFMTGLIPAVASQQDATSVKEILRTFLAAAGWIPYLFISKRVKGTFVH